MQNIHEIIIHVQCIHTNTKYINELILKYICITMNHSIKRLTDGRDQTLD